MARYADIDTILNELPDDLPYKASVKRVLMQASEANAVPLPCKVGDEVWTIRSYSNSNKAIKKGKVSEMYYIDESMRLCIVVKGIARGEWGKVVFPSYESAQEFLDKQ